MTPNQETKTMLTFFFITGGACLFLLVAAGLHAAITNDESYDHTYPDEP